MADVTNTSNDSARVADLEPIDIYVDLVALFGGAEDVDGIFIDHVEYDDTGMSVSLADAGGAARVVSLKLIES